MLRRSAVALTIVVVTIGAVNLAGAEPSGSSSGRVLRFFERDAQSNAATFATKLGEPLFWSGDLFDRKGGRHLGRMGGLCGVVGTAPHGDAQRRSVRTAGRPLSAQEAARPRRSLTATSTSQPSR